MALYSQIRPKVDHDEKMIDIISKQLNITRIAARLMVNRGITSTQEAYSYIHPDIEQLKDPFNLGDMQIAVDRIKLAIECGHKITVYGDYDVDGVTASAILYLYLEELGASVDVYIPDRYDEGYGLNIEAMEKLKNRGSQLLITVDCGITSIDEISYAKKIGMDVIVTDHHNIGDKLPPAIAIINPKMMAGKAQDELAGVGVAAKLIHAMGGIDTLGRFLDLVSIGTIADIVPLVGENRIFAAKGLELINTSPRVGVRALAEVSGLDYRNISSQDIAFGIAPRLNAAGRMGSAMDAFKLLISTNYREAEPLAAHLDELNNDRKNKEADILKQAREYIDSNLKAQDKIIVLKDKDWHVGIIGIAASKLVDIYRRPVILLANVGDGMYTGSARSIDGFNIYDAICSTSHILEEFGGHEQAAGITIREKYIPKLIENLQIYSNEHIDRGMLIPCYRYDAQLCNEDVTFDLCNDLEKMEPFGLANPMPMFLLEDAYIDNLRLVGREQNHMKLTIEKEGRLWDGIWFNSDSSKDSLDTNISTDMLVQLNKNEWNGLTKLQLNVQSLKVRANTENDFERFIDLFYIKFFDDFYSEFLYNKSDRCKARLEADQLTVTGNLSGDEMLKILGSSPGGNAVLVGDKNIAQELFKDFSNSGLIDHLEVSYADLIHVNGRGIDGMILIPQISSSRLNEYENIFIMTGDRFAAPYTLQSFQNKLWMVKSDIKSSTSESFLLARDDFILVYRWLQKVAFNRRFWDDIPAMLQDFVISTEKNYNYFQFRMILEVFKELGFLRCDIREGHVIAQLHSSPESSKLEASLLYSYYTNWLLRHGLETSHS